jgi:hypothetical protein
MDGEIFSYLTLVQRKTDLPLLLYLLKVLYPRLLRFFRPYNDAAIARPSTRTNTMTDYTRLSP